MRRRVLLKLLFGEVKPEELRLCLADRETNPSRRIPETPRRILQRRPPGILTVLTPLLVTNVAGLVSLLAPAPLQLAALLPSVFSLHAAVRRVMLELSKERRKT